MRLPSEKATLLQGERPGDFYVQTPAREETFIPKDQLRRSDSVSTAPLHPHDSAAVILGPLNGPCLRCCRTGQACSQTIQCAPV